MNPVARLKDLFSPRRAMVELILSGLRIGIVAYVSYRMSMVDYPTILTIGRFPLEILMISPCAPLFVSYWARPWPSASSRSPTTCRVVFVFRRR